MQATEDKREAYVPATDHGQGCKCGAEECTGSFPRLPVLPQWQQVYDREVLPSGAPASYRWSLPEAADGRRLNIGAH